MGGIYIGGRERRRELEFQFGKERITIKGPCEGLINN